MSILGSPPPAHPAHELLALIGRAIAGQQAREALKGPAWGGPAPASKELLGLVREMGACVRRWAAIDPWEAERLGNELMLSGDDARFAAAFGAYAALCSWEARGAKSPLDALWGDSAKIFKGIDTPHWSWHGRCRVAEMALGKREAEQVWTTFSRMVEALPPKPEAGTCSMSFDEAMAAGGPGWLCERGPSAPGLEALARSVGRAVDRQLIAQAAEPSPSGPPRRRVL